MPKSIQTEKISMIAAMANLTIIMRCRIASKVEKIA